jgi:hypothetical protein
MRDSSLRLRPEFTLSAAEGLRMTKRMSLPEQCLNQLPIGNIDLDVALALWFSA